MNFAMGRGFKTAWKEYSEWLEGRDYRNHLVELESAIRRVKAHGGLITPPR